jgi:hypothetical protein
MSPSRRRSRIRAGVVGALVALSAAVVAVPANARPPSNDEAAQATRIQAVPAVLEVDTREATYDAARRGCVYARSVWFRYVPDETSRVRITTIGSSYDTVLAVFSGTRSPQERLSCNDDAAGLQSAVRPRMIAGQRYWIAVSSCCGGRGAPGGDLVLRLSRGQVPPEVTVDVTQATAGGVSGRLRVYGTVVCATPSVAQIWIGASPGIEGAVARGTGYTDVPVCTTEPVEWVARIDSETGWAFRPGAVALDVGAVAQDGFSWAEQVFETNWEVTGDPLGRAQR